MSYRRLLPRQELKRLDNLPTGYPTVRRTGDPSRMGNYAIAFDDTRTITFPSATYTTASGYISTSQVSYPTTLSVASSYVTLLKSSLTAPGYTQVDAVEIVPLHEQVPQTEPVTPFAEYALHEQDLASSSFYASGTNVGDVGEGFDSNLGAKTKIRMTLPVGQTIYLNPSQAAIYYFNPQLQLFQEVAPGRKSVPANTQPLQTPYQDAKLFGPFGNTVLSGVNVVPFYGVQQQSQVKNNIPGAFQFSASQASVLLDPDFAPTGSQFIVMSNFINRPFLVEKASIEIPLVAGPGWLNDVTQYGVNGYRFTPDAGGPCLTFGLMNVIGNRRDMILSATLIPSGDNNSYTITYGSGSIFARRMVGFKSFASPNGVCPQPATQWGGNIGDFTIPTIPAYFTGTVIMYAQANTSNGIESYGTKAPVPQIPWQAQTWSDSYIASVDPFGRSMGAIASPRSYFGREFETLPVLNLSLTSSNIAKFGYPPNANTYDYPEVYQYEQQAASPYVLYPNDKIVLCVAKHRPIISVDANYNSLLAPTGSHDVAINIGRINITLYGSLIKEGAEFHDTLNSALATPAVHEMIGADPVIDQLELFYTYELSGSYTDNVISGSMVSSVTLAVFSAGVPQTAFGGPNQLVTGSRGIWTNQLGVSNTNQNAVAEVTYLNSAFQSEQIRSMYELTSNTRHVQCVSQGERYFDSLWPSIADIIHRSGNDTLVFPPGTLSSSPPSEAVLIMHFDRSDTNYNGFNDIVWSRSFPFEPRYSDLSRVISDQIYGSYQDNFGGPPRVSWERYLSFHQKMVFRIGTSATPGFDPYYLDSFAPLGVPTRLVGLRDRDSTAFLYGIGDYNNCYIAGGTTYGAANRVGVKELIFGFTTLLAGSTLRGWKYGLINGYATFTKAVYRRNHYGQFRDMLEQRRDSKFYDATPPQNIIVGLSAGTSGQTLTSPIQVRFVNSSGSLVQPQQTFSSNLSTEATSSLPYFDGIVRNREDPISLLGVATYLYT